jgi:hypothetical protein
MKRKEKRRRNGTKRKQRKEQAVNQTRKKITSRGKYKGHGLRIYSMPSASCNLMGIYEGQCMAYI